MECIAAVLAIVFVGGLIALQPPVNSQLARYTTVLAASFINSSTRRRSTDRASLWLVVWAPLLFSHDSSLSPWDSRRTVDPSPMRSRAVVCGLRSAPACGIGSEARGRRDRGGLG